MAGPIPDFGWSKARDAVDDPFKFFVENLLEQIKKYTGIDLFWMLDWSWATNSLLDLVRQANDLFAWLQNPVQRPPNLLTRPSFSSPSAIAEAPDWSWDAVVSLGSVTALSGRVTTDPQGSARTTADGSRHAMMSNAITDKAALTPGQILTCQVHALVEDGFTASDDQAIRLEIVPSRYGVLQDAVVLAHCGVPDGDPGDWIAAPTDSKAVFFDVDYEIPTEDSPDTVELRLVVDESAGGDVPVRFDGARCSAAGGFLVVLSDLFDAGRAYLTDMWNAITEWLEDVFAADAWTTLTTATDAAFELFVKRVKRALRHADADTFHPPTTSSMLSNALKNNQWFGWLFEMVDNWLQPVLNTGKAAADFGQACWDAVTAFVSAPGAAGAWSTLTSTIESAWNTMVDEIFAAWGSPRTHTDIATPATATETALRNNAWFGWLFDLVDDWLQPVLNIGKAVTDFGDACWKAITTFSAAPSASGAWTTMINAINSAWASMVDAILAAWGSPKTHADFASPSMATEAAIKNNPVTGWLFGGSSGNSWWLNLFDPVRRFVNQMVEGLHWGYFDVNWAWVSSLTTPTNQLPGSGTVMTPGRNDDDGGGIAPQVDTSIPAAPTGLAAVPWLDFTVSGFPAGKLTYAVAAMKGSIEGPAVQVTAFAGTLIPPNTSAHVDLGWNAVSDATSYKIYRKVDATYQATDWRLINMVSTAYSYLSPYQDKTPRSGGTVAHPKTDAELAAQIVTDVKTTATGAATTAGSAQATASSAASTANAAQSTANDAATAASSASDAASSAEQQAIEAASAAALASVKAAAIPEGNIVISNLDPDEEDWGVEYEASGGATWKAPNNGGLADDSVSWSQSVPAGSRLLFIFASMAGSGAATGLDISLSDQSFTAPGRAITGQYANTFRVIIGDHVANSARGSIAAWTARVPAGWSGGSVTITAAFSDAAIVDISSVVVGGTASGDFDVITTSGTNTAPADSLVLSFAGQYAQSATVATPSLLTGFTSARSTSNQACVQPYNQDGAGTELSMTYGEASRLATRNIDTQVDITYPAAPTNALSMAVVVKSVPNPGPTVGSFARIKTNTTTEPPVNSMVGNVLPLSGYYEILERSSPDITVSLSNCSFEVSYVGTYHVEYSVAVTKLSDGNSSYTPVVLVNGDVYSHGGTVPQRVSAGTNYTAGNPITTHSCLVYATAGDVISFGVYSDLTGSSYKPIVSRANARPKHASISLVNRSYL
ncbi:hypothetical protein PP713_14115 [Mycobacterium sp. CSUR Q5927]|nr:hypothetical protein [Mycobacterium sp. CSUR Q5927]